MNKTLTLFIIACSLPLLVVAEQQAQVLIKFTASETGHGQFCAQAQQLIAQTTLPVTNIVHTDFDAYVSSKPGLQPLTSHQFTLRSEGDAGLATIVSCKMKTAELINETFGEGSAGDEQRCADLIHSTLDQVYADLPAQAQLIARQNIIVEDDDSAWMGPQWLDPWPYTNAVEKSGELHLRAKAMHIPFAWYIPMPDRFKGTHYCHLPAPEYLAALISGQLKANAP